MKVDDILMVIIGLLSLIIFYKIYKGSLIEGVESGGEARCHTNQQCPGVTCPPGGTKEKPVLCPRVITDKKCNERCDERCAKKKKKCPEIEKITIDDLEDGWKNEKLIHIRNNAKNAPYKQMLQNYMVSDIYNAVLETLHNQGGADQASQGKMFLLLQGLTSVLEDIILHKGGSGRHGYDDATYKQLYNKYIKEETEFYDEFIKDRINNYMDKQKDSGYQGFKIKDD